MARRIGGKNEFVARKVGEKTSTAKTSLKELRVQLRPHGHPVGQKDREEGQSFSDLFSGTYTSTEQ